MKIAAAFSVLICDFCAFPQVAVTPPPAEVTFGGVSPATPTQGSKLTSPSYPLGTPHTRLSMEGWLVWSDGKVFSIELQDQRLIRFDTDSAVRYFPESGPAGLASFRMADFVHVESEVDAKGFVVARSLRFVRPPSAAEQSEISQSPEVMQSWRGTILAGRNLDAASDDRKLSLVGKPQPAGLSPDTLIGRARQFVDSQFENLPSLRAKQITSMFKSTSKPVKWVPDGIVTDEVAYEDDRESYSELAINGKPLVGAIQPVTSDFMRSMDKAWSTGDFKTISHCVFSELADSDFTSAGTVPSNGETLDVINFRGQRSSGCIGINFRSEITYPSFRGSMQVRPKTGEILHLDLEATDIPAAFPLDRAERSVDFEVVPIGESSYLLPKTAYWFGCFRNTYSCFLNRIDFHDYRRFHADSTIRFEK